MDARVPRRVRYFSIMQGVFVRWLAMWSDADAYVYCTRINIIASVYGGRIWCWRCSRGRSVVGKAVVEDGTPSPLVCHPGSEQHHYKHHYH